MWKESFVIPLHKKGSKVEACNYRGISKFSAIPKLFENIITSTFSTSVGQLSYISVSTRVYEAYINSH